MSDVEHLFKCLFAHLYVPGGSLVKNPPAKQGMRVWSPGQEDPPEREMATHSSILAWDIPWTVEPGRLQPMGSEEPGGLLSLGLQTVLHVFPAKEQ